MVKDEARQKWAGDGLEALLQLCTAQSLPKSFKRMRNKLASWFRISFCMVKTGLELHGLLEDYSGEQV